MTSERIRDSGYFGWCCPHCRNTDGYINITSIYDPRAVDEYHVMRKDITSMDLIVDNIDGLRQPSLRNYIFALRDLQHAHDTSAYESNDAEIEQAFAVVQTAFQQLRECHDLLLREHLGAHASTSVM